MLAEAILVHGVIGYKFCWLLPPEDQNQGTPTGNESHNLELFIAFTAIGWRPKIFHIIHNLELFIASKGLSS